VGQDNRDDGTKDKLEEHSLPGTNQAGKGPGSRDDEEARIKAGRGHSQHADELEEHSLPGTNQAGKGPGSSKKDHPVE
jgi:hypothetical protein